MTFKLTFSALLLLAVNAYAGSVLVPGDQATIQGGINAATDGDTVLVAPGVYTGIGNRHITLGGQTIVLLSEAGPEVTIIDCRGSESDQQLGFILYGGNGSQTVTDGFTITGGVAPTGSGLSCSSGSHTIKNCIIEGNSANEGAVIHISGTGASVDFIDCIIQDNDGFGLTCENFGEFSLIGCQVSDRIWCYVAGSSSLTDCLITNSGIGICCASSLAITDCIFSGSSGFSSSDYASATITNCTFYNSRSIAAVWAGPYTTEINIDNCIFAFGVEGVPVYIDTVFGTLSDVTLSSCNIYGNANGDWVGMIAGQLDLRDNFSVDPQFCDTAAGDFHVAEGSWCDPGYSSSGLLVGALPVGCQCCTNSGDVDNNGSGPDIADLVYLVDYMFVSGDLPECPGSTDIDGNGVGPDIADLVYLVDYMFVAGPPPVPCGESGAILGKAIPNTDEVVIEVAVEDGMTTLFLNSSMDLRGIELDLSGPEDSEPLKLFEDDVDMVSGVIDGYRRIGILDLDGDQIIAAGRKQIITLDGEFELERAIVVDLGLRALNANIGAAAKESELPMSFALSQNYPNPFNPSTTISFALPTASQVRLEIFNILGQSVGVLVDRQMEAGHHEATWDASSNSSGVYFYRVTTETVTDSRKMVMMK